MKIHFSNNIKFLRKRKGYTQDEVAENLGMKRSTLSGIENEVSQPTISALLTFSKFYKVAIDTLLNVDLQKLSELQLRQLEHGEDVFIKGGRLRVLATTVNADNDENIELVAEKAKAGYATGFADPEFISQLPTFQLPFLSKQKKYRTFQLSGDSMLPIPDKSWVTAEYLQDWSQIVSGEAYVVFTLDDGIVFKVAENMIKEEGKVRLYSLNPLYEPYDIQVSEIKEIWKFVHFISKEIPEPMLPQDELLKTVASLKSDMDKMKRQMLRPGISKDPA
ncbi:MAG: helix-turn-helix domain-containing protein [Bacteroidales bacterium]|nr:helix-turn-helix domain-containing protein [Bacteroidales bacterium]